jgi:hypothetical protein
MTIRPTDYEKPKVCKKIIGYDANTLYLWRILQEMQTVSIPITSLEFVCGVCLFDVAIHWKAPTFYHFLVVVVMMSDMVSALLSFPMCTNNIIGGPSIVFHRYHERDVTTIRPTE